MSSTTTPGASGRDSLVETFTEFFRQYYDDRSNETSQILDLAEKYPSEKQSLTIDYDDIFRYDRDLADDIISNPEDIIAYAEEALRQYDIPIDIEFQPNVRLGGLDAFPITHSFEVGQYTVDYEGSMIALNGQVNKVDHSKGSFEEIAFVCQLCGSLTRMPQAGEYQEPHECQGCERQGPFKIDFQQSEVKDYQLVRLQLPPEKAHHGNQKGSVDVRLTGEELVDSVVPGDRITAATKLTHEIDDEDAGTFVLTGEVNNVEHQETDYEDLNLDEYEDEIKEIANSQNPHEKVIDSIKPSHKGDEDIKHAIALQMFGGVKKKLPDGDEVRGRTHILLMGDPGTDKSGLLSYARDLSPRSVYTSGQSATAAGLTCAAVQDDFGDGGWTIEGGALVKAHNGLCAIDEFDKMDDEDQSGVMEALSEGTISPAKANISDVTLPAESTVLSAANPKYGRFDEYQPISDQIDLDPALFSRFDLIFTMSDTPDQHEDAQLATHINNSGYVGGMIAAGKEPEQEALEDVEPEIDPEVMRRYIAYAKQTITPVLSEEARYRFKEFYTQLRDSVDEDDSAVPVTVRRLHALHRLGEASARIRLDETVTINDAERAISIVKNCMNDVGVDPDTGEFDADLIETGTSASQRDRIKNLKAIIEDTELEYDDGAPVDIVHERASEIGMDAEQVEHEIQNLKDKGEVYEPKTDHLRST